MDCGQSYMYLVSRGAPPDFLKCPEWILITALGLAGTTQGHTVLSNEKRDWERENAGEERNTIIFIKKNLYSD